MSTRITQQLVCDAMQMAKDSRSPQPNVIVNSDRGSQYCSKQFQKLLRKYELKPNMIKKGDCFDKACDESFSSQSKLKPYTVNNFLPESR